MLNERIANMNKTPVTLILSLVLVCSVVVVTSAYGADEKGNGGHIVQCRNGDGSIRSRELLDIYEARDLMDLEPDLGPSNLTEVEKALFVVQRLKAFDAGKAQELEEGIRTFFSEKNSVFVDGVLPYVADTGVTHVPEGCGLEQFAIRQEPQIGTDRLFTISKPLWDSVSTDSRAALMLHELLYKMADKFNETSTSRRSRNFVSRLISDALPKSTLTSYNSWLAEHGFEQASRYVGGVKLVEAATRVDTNGDLVSKLFNGQVFTFAHRMKVSAVADANIVLDSNQKILKIDTPSRVIYEEGTCKVSFAPVVNASGQRFFTFHPNGELRQGLNNEFCLTIGGETLQVSNVSMPYSETERFRTFEFHSTGVIQRAFASENVALPVATWANFRRSFSLVFFSKKTYFELHPTGFVKSGVVVSDTELKMVNGDFRHAAAGSLVEFDEQGFAK